MGCSSVTEITISDTVTSIGSYAFAGCSGLEYIKLGKGVSSIISSAFSGISALKTIEVDSENTEYTVVT